MRIDYFPTYLLLTDPAETLEEWVLWLESECPIHRFGEDVPVDYYDKLERWWVEACQKPEMCQEPIKAFLTDQGIMLWDGHHRYAMSLKNNIHFVPIEISNPVP